MVDAVKVCTGCGEALPRSEFPPKGRHVSSRCRPCRNAYMRDWSARHPDAVSATNKAYKRKDGGRTYKNVQLKHNFGITIEQYEQMLRAQGGKCACCGGDEIARHQNGKIRQLAVDHCHTTGSVRGLLCSLCNRALGMLRDDPRRIESLLRYLKG